jgi:hypothetical protein
MYPEYDEGTGAAEREGLLWAARSTPTAFWPFEDQLVRMLHAGGFE